MAVTKEIAQKVERYLNLMTEANEIFNELEELFQREDLMGGLVNIEEFGVAGCEPSEIAEPTENGEYNQITTRFEDSVWGTYYFPIENSKRYVVVDYST